MLAPLTGSLLCVILLLFSSVSLAQSQPTDWAQKMTASEIKRNPQAWAIEGYTKPKWNYTQGLVLYAMSRVYQQQPDEKLLAYIKEYADTLIDERGEIRGYEMEKYNIDMINAGKILFFLHEQTGDPRYVRAMHILRQQLSEQPRTSEGGFWHKKIYPFQMWLDGLYMGAPFYAEYANWFSEGKASFDDIALQFRLIERHAKDPQTGLLYHGWDESRQQRWADPQSGTSANFWSRSLGWYAMALVDVLDQFPKGHPDRAFLKHSLASLAQAVSQYQHDSGLWYQVTDQGDREGNYLEASGTSMFVYAFARGVNQGYLDPRFMAVAKKGFEGLTGELIKNHDDGEITLTQVCAVAGLGGDPYRDGSFEYYVNEKKRDNDPKATGPFILAALELSR
ncbi:glycosyl hydrolase family 88 [Lacimicrobium alkaliphilum]|uniref:Glycosyl hydrolase family 88 n=2 Tax=Lacimicrobium alkaliphilum TaxID=1526571 RepID=A0A0U3AQZ4_9ALTE|nr:glycosyl hydrolase family 88 [Lacimicrobium alkaliphilum]